VLPTIIRRPSATPELPDAGVGPTTGAESNQLLIAFLALGLGVLGLGYWRMRLND
jgi:LPXTG-motif cell wall-anchored protein